MCKKDISCGTAILWTLSHILEKQRFFNLAFQSLTNPGRWHSPTKMSWKTIVLHLVWTPRDLDHFVKANGDPKKERTNNFLFKKFLFLFLSIHSLSIHALLHVLFSVHQICQSIQKQWKCGWMSFTAPSLGAMTHSHPRGSSPEMFSTRKPQWQIWQCWFSSWSYHTELQTTEPHHQQIYIWEIVIKELMFRLCLNFLLFLFQ